MPEGSSRGPFMEVSNLLLDFGSWWIVFFVGFSGYPTFGESYFRSAREKDLMRKPVFDTRTRLKSFAHKPLYLGKL